MGLNIPNIDIVVNLGVAANLSDVWQAAGRAGRRGRGGRGEKSRAVSVIYNILNASDLAHHSDKTVKAFMNSKECLKKGEDGLMPYFGWNPENIMSQNVDCCINCNP